MVGLDFISCSFELHIWFIMKISEVALLLAWTPVLTIRRASWVNSCLVSNDSGDAS